MNKCSLLSDFIPFYIPDEKSVMVRLTLDPLKKLHIFQGMAGDPESSSGRHDKGFHFSYLEQILKSMHKNKIITITIFFHISDY